MKCDKLEKLSYSNYEELEKIINATSVSFKKHLSECDDCRNYLAAARKTEKFFNTMSESSLIKETFNISVEAESVKIASKIKKIKDNDARVNKISVAQPVETGGIVEKIMAFFASRMTLASIAAILVIVIALYAGWVHLNKKGPAINDIAGVNENKEPVVGYDEKDNSIDKSIKISGYIIDESSGSVMIQGVENKTQVLASSGMRFESGYIIKTAAAAKCVLSSKFVKVKIEGAVEAKLDELNIVISAGMARMEFNKNTLSAHKPFKVNTGGLAAIITGTVIEAVVEKNMASIKLISGKIKLDAIGPHASAVKDYSLNPGDTIKAVDNSNLIEIYDGTGIKIKTFTVLTGEPKDAQLNHDNGTTSVQSVTGNTFSAPVILDLGNQNSGAGQINNKASASGKTDEIIINDQPSDVNSGANPFLSN